MSWLKEKFWSGKKHRVASCTIDDTLRPIDHEANFQQVQLKNFMANGQSVITEIIGYEIISEVVQVCDPRRNMSFTRSLFLH